MPALSQKHRIPDVQYLDLIKSTEFRPVFIVGAHRSGTTLLHRLLAETGCFNYISAFFVNKYDRLLAAHAEGRLNELKQELAKAFAQLAMKDRGIDESPASADTPAEYGFILAPESRRPRTTPETFPKLVELCRKIQYISDRNKQIVLKNPWDTVRFAYLKAALPQAMFVFIHRHPLFIMSSFLRALRMALAGRNDYLQFLAPWYGELFHKPLELWLSRLALSPRVGLGESLMARYMIRVTEYFLRHIETLPKSDYVMIRYEDLCAAPVENMERILAFLNVTPEHKLDLGELIRPRRLTVLPEIKRKYLQVRRSIEPYLDYHRYEILPPGTA